MRKSPFQAVDYIFFRSFGGKEQDRDKKCNCAKLFRGRGPGMMEYEDLQRADSRSWNNLPRH